MAATKLNHSLVNQALEYLEQGFSIIPVKKNNKRPYLSSWTPYQTRQPEKAEVLKWWRKWPNANIAIVAGAVSDVTVLDFDNHDALPQLEALAGTIPDTFRSKTAKGKHIYLKYCPGLKNAVRLKSKNGDTIEVDIRNDGGYVVAPGSVHDTGIRYEWLGDAPADYDDWREELEPVPHGVVTLVKAEKNTGNLELDLTALSLDSVLNGVKEGERDNQIFKYACSLRARNLSETEAWTLIKHAALKCSPPFSEKEARTKFIQAWKYEPNSADTEYTEPIWDSPVDMQKVLSELPPTIKWLVDNRVPAGRGIGIVGLGGSSKTRILYMLAIGAITGKLSWSWEINRTGWAVLVLTEDTANDVHRVIHSLTRGFTPEEQAAVTDGLIIYPLAGKDTRLLVKNKNGTLEKSSLYHSLEDKIKDTENVVFVGWDPALSVSEGDELDQGHQRALGKAADDMAVNTGATVALVCHAAKGSLQQEELSSHNARGGGAITDALRAEYSVRNMTPKEGNKANVTDMEERKRHIQLVATKGNNVPPAAFVPVWLRRDDFGNLTEADIEMDGNEGTLSKRDIEILKVHTEMGAISSPKLEDWRAKCVENGLIKGDTPNAQKQAMQRVLTKLTKAGRLTKGIGRGFYNQPPEVEELPF